MSMNEAMNGMMNQGNVTAAQAVEQFGVGAYASPIEQAVPTQVTEAIEQAEPKMYEIRPLNARDIFPMTKIIRKIGLKDFGKCFEPEEIKAITDTFSENSEEKSMEDFYLPIFLERAEQVYGYTPEKVKELEKEMRVHFAEIQAKEELKD